MSLQKTSASSIEHACDRISRRSSAAALQPPARGRTRGRAWPPAARARRHRTRRRSGAKRRRAWPGPGRCCPTARPSAGPAAPPTAARSPAEEVRDPDTRPARPVGGRPVERGADQQQVGRPELAALSARHLGAVVDLAGPRVEAALGAQHELAADLAHHKHVSEGVAVAGEVARDLVRLGRVEH